MDHSHPSDNSILVGKTVCTGNRDQVLVPSDTQVPSVLIPSAGFVSVNVTANTVSVTAVSDVSANAVKGWQSL